MYLSLATADAFKRKACATAGAFKRNTCSNILYFLHKKDSRSVQADPADCRKSRATVISVDKRLLRRAWRRRRGPLLVLGCDCA